LNPSTTNQFEDPPGEDLRLTSCTIPCAISDESTMIVCLIVEPSLRSILTLKGWRFDVVLKEKGKPILMRLPGLSKASGIFLVTFKKNVAVVECDTQSF
jgi:hypothetical protein